MITQPMIKNRLHHLCKVITSNNNAEHYLKAESLIWVKDTRLGIDGLLILRFVLIMPANTAKKCKHLRIMLNFELSLMYYCLVR